MNHQDFLQFQALHHPLVQTERFETVEQFCLHLMHVRAYEEAAQLAAGKTVLDVGCNNGYGTRILAATALSARGVDVSEYAIAAARGNCVLPNLSFECTTGGALPFRSETFDVVTSFQVIEHLLDYSGYLGEIQRVLKPGGIAIFTTPNAEIRLDPGMKPWFPFHVREFSGQELGELLRAWFSQVEVRGLFACQSLYEIEYERVQRSLHRARRQAKAWLPPYLTVKAKVIDLAKSALPKYLVRHLQDTMRRVSGAMQAPRTDQTSPPLPPFTTKSLYYATDNTSQALDLMAVCHNGIRHAS